MGILINLYCTDVWRDNGRTLTIAASVIRNGSTMLPMKNSIPRDTLYVCLRNAPTVEFFIHDARGAQILMLVSESGYRNHEPMLHSARRYEEAARDPIPGTRVQYVYMTRKPSHVAINHQAMNALLVADDDRKRFLFGLLE